MAASIVYSNATASNSMLPYRTSTAKNADPIGDRKIAESPADIPMKISIFSPHPCGDRSSPKSSPRLRQSAPLVLPGPPTHLDPIVMAEATSFSGATRARMNPPAR